MSTAVSTNRASNRPSKDKHAKTANQPTQPKSEGPPPQAKATPEQIRIAQMISVTDGINTDAEFQKRVDQVIEITGRDRETCEIALHDSKNDVDKAVGMLLEGELDKGLGEWKATGKKKKQKPQQQTAPSKTDNVSNHIDEKSKNEQINDSEKTEHREPRQESGNRRGRRFDTRPPRLARGRGREKTDVFRSDRVNGEAESDSNFGTFNKDRDFEGGRGRGRGRGRGGRGRGGAGGSTGSGRGRSYNRSQRFDSGPQIDTWTNETAENAEKENSMGGWGDTAEDWNDDTWTGNLTESKIFTASAVQSNQATEEPSPLTDTTSSIGQRLDLGALLQKPSNDSETSYISQYNQQATETIKNTIGIGSGTRQYSSQEPTSQPYSNPMSNATLTNHLQPVSLGSQLPSSLSNQMPSLSSSQSASAAVEALVSTFTQQSQNLTNTAIDQMNSNSVLPVSQNSASVSPPSVPSQHSVLQQRTKPQRSKLPPPSKIPASAVEMPGHQMTTLDVQFGNWEFSESSQFAFGSGNESIVSSSLSSTVPSSTSSSINSHKSQVSKQSESVISSSMISTPQNNSTSVMSGQDSPRSNMFHNSPYTTPTKSDTGSLGQSKMNPPEPIPFPPSQSDRKSSPLMAPQRPGSSSSLTQGSLSTSKSDGGSLNFSQSAPGGYQSNSFHQTQNSVLSGTTGLSNSSGLARDSSGLSNTSMTNAAGLSNSTGLSNSSGLSSSAGLSNSSGLSRDTSGLSRDTSGLSNSSGMASNGLSSTSGLSHTPAYSHPSTSQPSLLQTQYQAGSNQYQTSQNQYQTGQNQYPSSNQYSSQNQYQSYGQSGSNYQNPNTYSGSTGYSGSSQATQNSLYQTTVSNSYQSQSTQNSLYHQSSQSSSYPQQSSQSSYHSSRDSQAPGSYTTNVSQSGSVSFQRDPASGLATVSTQNQPAYSSQTYGTSSHQSSLQTPNKISETLSKISVKDSSLDTRQSPQYDNSTSTSTASLTTTTATTSLSTGTSTPSAVSSATMTTNTSSSSARTSSSLSTTTTTSKALPNLPPGVQLLGHQYIMGQMGQGTVPYIGLQQPMYANYDELMLQQRIPPLSYNYDLSGFGVPTTLTSRDQTSLGNVPYSGAENKLTRVDAQSPIPSTQQSSQSTHQQQQQQQQQQHFINLPYGYYYPSMVPNAAAAAGFQFPGAMFPVPPVTNTAAHAGTTANTQFPKTYGTHAYGNNKAYEELTQGSDFSKPSYVNQSQNKVSAVSAVASVGGVAGGTDIPGTGYGKAHTQMVNKKDRISKSNPRNLWIKHDGFDKQGFHAGTPPPFGLPIATGTQPLGAPTNPYAGPAPFVQMMPHQAHSQMLHAGLQQDSTSGSSRGSHVHAQQSSAQGKGSSGKYGAGYWGAS